MAYADFNAEIAINDEVSIPEIVLEILNINTDINDNNDSESEAEPTRQAEAFKNIKDF